jgi:hypothetical protein
LELSKHCLEKASGLSCPSVSSILAFSGNEDMQGIKVFRRKQPWRDALVATTGLSVFVLASSMLWNSGHQEWAFALTFVAIWLLLFISWSNIDFAEESGSILASIVDHNFDQMSERIDQLEQALATANDLARNLSSEAASSLEYSR